MGGGRNMGTLKFNRGNISLWQGVGKKTNFPNIGIKFHKTFDKKEIDETCQIIKSILEFRYGKGEESKEYIMIS
jgi:hypothetical protein